MKEYEFYIRVIYKDKTRKCIDTVKNYIVDRTTAKKLLEKTKYTLRNLGKLSPKVVDVQEERGMFVITELWRA